MKLGHSVAGFAFLGHAAFIRNWQPYNEFLPVHGGTNNYIFTLLPKIKVLILQP